MPGLAPFPRPGISVAIRNGRILAQPPKTMRYSDDCVMQRVRVISIMEADFVTGPAKNLIELGQRARPEVDLSVVAYLRGAQSETEFIRAARAAELHVDVVHER